MSEPVYTDGELITAYRLAKDPAAQIGILADLRGMSREEMTEHLRRLGCDVPAGRTGRKDNRGADKLPFDGEIARNMYDNGYHDFEIARTLGVPRARVQRWRAEEGLAGNRKRSRPGIEVKGPLDELRAEELWREGLNDMQIAECLGETPYRVRQWRIRMHHEPNRKRRAEEAAQVPFPEGRKEGKKEGRKEGGMKRLLEEQETGENASAGAAGADDTTLISQPAADSCLAAARSRPATPEGGSLWKEETAGEAESREPDDVPATSDHPEKAGAPQKEPRMRAAALAGLLEKVAAGWPDAVVELADEGELVCAELCVDFDAEGREEGARLRLYPQMDHIWGAGPAMAPAMATAMATAMAEETKEGAEL